ncbi:hypothetical protein N7489_011383 [Penicillium chrysogenum]|uniref:Vacuolar protein-sorting-associated protein n=1 Tax=Penicillium chrysogenum TaxID=5076 RepID=A0ABQ8W1F3_PENCH|nr:uncharacterized protein N7489_011383 [Penicillium chrysogenum]KAJ5230675.1 hypothetical protein N7489_011383 [Penicillium chrysogenum]KAJ5254551.1 hypothetical protein N7505_011760 [Penicillium chrysogenum]KAJ5268151.1 hypothetical protein N7524_005610 [Penicillium chrysogenum]
MTTTPPFPFPPTYNFPPSSPRNQTQQPATRSLRNGPLRKRLDLREARAVVDWMTKSEEEGGGGRRAEWISDAGGASSLGLGNGAGQGPKTVAWIWWRRPEEWADVLVDWVEGTGQKGSVLTVYELIHGEGAMSQEFHGMDTDVMLRSLNVLVKRGRAQIFGGEGQEGVKFF